MTVETCENPFCNISGECIVMQTFLDLKSPAADEDSHFLEQTVAELEQFRNHPKQYADCPKRGEVMELFRVYMQGLGRS